MAGLDENTKLLLHFDGANESTTIPDSSITNNKGNATVVATAKLDTSVKKFGTASLILDGNSDYITFADDADWDVAASNSDNWTIDFWVKMDNIDIADRDFMGQYVDNINFWSIGNNQGDGGLNYWVREASVFEVRCEYGPNFPDTDWHHVAMCKVADKYGLYLDGIQDSYVQDSDIANFTGLLYIGAGIGAGDNPTFFIPGHIDELRIQKSNYFNAAPNATPDDTITVPTEAYSGIDITNATFMGANF